MTHPSPAHAPSLVRPAPRRRHQPSPTVAARFTFGTTFAAALATLTTLIALSPVSAIAASPATSASDAPDFLRDVRPILSSYCFKCHGPDEDTRKGGVRLDIREEALKPGKSGQRAIVPGRPDQSEIIARILTKDEDELMPPPAVKHPLEPRHKEILQRWIRAGAEYRPHWAFVAPGPVTPPKHPGFRNPDFPIRNPIDAFVAERLQAEKLKPSPPADRLTLARRLHLDLIGLPPSPEEADAFARDTRPQAYEELVDRLLASPHYGERWARKWLDLARYADSNGYEKDRDRSIWPYRDWVIRALNADLPFDQFTIEQIAGDMLPNPTLDQRIATGFHRNTMLNEEGGIDPLEFRFHAMVDRVNTTGTAWLGLTLGCAQCHTHKYDPILHTDYYQMMAMLNNADEPDLDLPPADAAIRQQEREERARQLLAGLPDRWPVQQGSNVWDRAQLKAPPANSPDPASALPDGSLLFKSPGPDRSDVTVEFTLGPGQTNVTHLKLEALTDDSLPSKGPGRTPHGNFVLSEITLSTVPPGAASDAAPARLAIRSATASAQQDSFPVQQAFDGQPGTGWAVHETGKTLNAPHHATLELEQPIRSGPGTRVLVRLRQTHGGHHTIGRLALSLGSPRPDADANASSPTTLAERRAQALEKAFQGWLTQERAAAVRWTHLPPARLKSNLPILTPQPDHSILASGDISKSDRYEITFTNLPGRITALRLEALPHDSLPAHGPGLTYYEGPKGDFFLGEFQVHANGRPVTFSRASESYAKNNFGGNASARAATDGDPQTGWTCAGRPGEAHAAVFIPSQPIEASQLDVHLLFGRHYACSLGRFRLSATTEPREPKARDFPEDLERLLLTPDHALGAADRARLKEQFLLSAPELASAAREIRQLRRPPSHPITLALRERPADQPRPTHLHKRGEFLQPAQAVTPDTPKFLPGLPGNPTKDRLALARWLVSPENPLTARVVANRHWSAFFGHGIVATENDFGFQGELPSHPALLDWLAREFIREGWSTKKLHRLIVTSSTYRQDARTTPALLERDPKNRLLARGPRVRLEAEQIRDLALSASRALSPKMFGPPVRPPQPAGVTEAAYGSPRWEVSSGEDRHRRSIYTFQKRSAPFAMFTTFDAPSGETCVARREPSNTPLQALTLLNDIAFAEAARQLGTLTAQQAGPDTAKATFLFRRTLTRPPTAAETTRLVAFAQAQRQRLQAGDLKAAPLATGSATPPGSKADTDWTEAATWTAVARAVLNLDETVNKP